MNRFLKEQSLIQLLGWAVVGLVLMLLVLGGWRYSTKPSQADNAKVVRRSLNRAAAYFKDEQQQLLDRSELASAKITALLSQNSSPDYLYDHLYEFSDFWGLTLYKDARPYVWKGMAIPKNDTLDFISYGSSAITLQKDHNLTYWECHMKLSLPKSSASYNLVTYYRITQRNPLVLGGKAEFNIFNSSGFSSSYPLRYSVFGPPPEHSIQRQTLENLQGDSVGVVYATADKFHSRETSWQKNTRFWRSVYVLFCLLVLAYFVVKTSNRLPLIPGLALELLFLILGWALLSYTHLPSYWIQTFTPPSSDYWVKNIRQIGSIFTNTIFALFIALAFTYKLNRFDKEIPSNWYITTMGIAILVGLLNMISIPFAISVIFHAANDVDISLMTLRILPNAFIILMYLAIGMGILALGLALVTLNRLLFRLKKRYFVLSTSALPISFMISLLIAQLFLPEKLVLNWIFFTSILGFACIFLASIACFKYKNWIETQSTFRKIVIVSLMISATGMPIVYHVSQSHTDKVLMEKAQKNIIEKDPTARKLTKKLLVRLEKEFKDVSSEYLTKQPSALQARFEQVMQHALSNSDPYSYNVQLIDSTDKRLADYATGLHAPSWINMYNVPTLLMVMRMNGVTKSSLHPIIQLPKLTNEQRYLTFYRGWIPLFGRSEHHPIGWILCSVYRKHPDYNKPIRAVLASMNAPGMNSYLMQKFNDGNLVNYEQEGPMQYFPKYQKMRKGIQQKMQTDSLLYITEKVNESTYRSLYWKSKPHQVINVSTVQADYRVILFSMFWFSFSLLLLGTLLTLIFQVATRGKIKFLGNYRYFQDRILDNFLLATLGLIILLIISFHFAIKRQNKNTVQENLFEKLDKLSAMVTSSPSFTSRRNATQLDSLTQPLNVDASFYQGRTLTKTTTPQIYQQHLLSSILPYPVFNRLYIQKQQETYSTVKLAGQSLAIGYRAILNDEHQPVAAIAIPTFLQSPEYNQQLLEITSYLILFYLLIFGLFIIGAVLISARLTRPLGNVRRGLDSISSGDLDTKINVRSNDEIGQLAQTYNNMVSQLKQLQEELAEAEREAAWKEMAQQVAHEIKNPLTPMKLNIQHLERQLSQQPEDPAKLHDRIKKITGNIIDQIQSLNNIASNFSKFSQPLDEPFTEVNLSDLLASVSELYEHDDNVEVHLHQPNHPIYTLGVADELKRVFINMIKNAYEAMPGGGKIGIKLYSRQQHAFIEIEDNGMGIAEGNHANIFVPNFSTKSSGTGLGLAICKKIVGTHHGNISFVSIEGEGTTFVIKLPEPDSNKNDGG